MQKMQKEEPGVNDTILCGLAPNTNRSEAVVFEKNDLCSQRINLDNGSTKMLRIQEIYPFFCQEFQGMAGNGRFSEEYEQDIMDMEMGIHLFDL